MGLIELPLAIILWLAVGCMAVFFVALCWKLRNDIVRYNDVIEKAVKAELEKQQKNCNCRGSDA